MMYPNFLNKPLFIGLPTDQTATHSSRIAILFANAFNSFCFCLQVEAPWVLRVQQSIEAGWIMAFSFDYRQGTPISSTLVILTSC